MKKQIFAVIVALGMSIVINASQTYAQTHIIRAEVPFAFSARDTILPAGTYIIKPATDSRAMWTIRSVYQKPGTALMAKTLSGSERSGNARLTFHRYGNVNFLVGFTTDSDQVKLPTSNSEKNLKRSLEKNVAGNVKFDVVMVATVPKK